MLTVLAGDATRMHTSAEIAETLGESAVMVRRCFLALSAAGMIVQRKGPNGGAKLKLPAKQIGIGDVYAATVGEWLVVGDKPVESLMKRVRAEAVAAMNETPLSQVVKRAKKG